MKAKFITAVEEGNLVRVRLFLSNELMLDPRGKTFNEMKTYAESRFGDLYEADNGIRYEMGAETWNQDFLFNLKNDLDSNFSRERLDLYENVAKIVLKDKADFLDQEDAKETESHQLGIYSDVEYNASEKKRRYTRITAGSAVVALTGMCFSKAALTTLGIAGVVVGSVLLYKESKK